MDRFHGTTDSSGTVSDIQMKTVEKSECFGECLVNLDSKVQLISNLEGGSRVPYRDPD